MKHTSIVNVALMRNTVRRFWPLCLAALAVLVLTLVVPAYTMAPDIMRTTTGSAAQDFDIALAMEDYWVVANLETVAYALIACAIAVIAMSEYLFDGRAAIFAGSLPLPRRTVFATTALAELAMLAIVPILAALALVPLALAYPLVMPLGTLFRWLALALLLTFCFFSAATLSAQLSASRPVAVLIYFVVTSLVACLEAAANTLVSALLYGVVSEGMALGWLSPAYQLSSLALAWDGLGTAILVEACAHLAVSVLALVASAILFDRRQLEVAGDSVAFGWLRPTLSCLAGISLGMLFGFVYRFARSLDFSSALPMTGTEVILTAALMGLGAFLGVLFAEMIMARTTHVFARMWKGGLALALACAGLVGLCRADILGLSRAVPDPTKVESVTVNVQWSDLATFTSPEAISEVCDLQRDIISYGGAGDSHDQVVTATFTYQLEGDRVFQRIYPIVSQSYDVLEDPSQDMAKEDRSTWDEGTLLLASLADLADSPEGRSSRFGKLLADPDTLRIEFEYATNQGTYESLVLTSAERTSLVEEALTTDLMEEAAGQALKENSWLDDAYDVSLSVTMPLEGDSEYADGLYRQLHERTLPHTVAWLREHHPEVELTRLNTED